ncbi:uncharacterized protein LOC113517620 isoform X1 [Galleria mellonella]|uniref:Uncharacterized protein LOC113517620 isoform X1 n=1 Tax=Galleria mellonella TaxID=7137 RepID=A0ABM3N1D9_GALME|nr:uncharacterized protein LOC113517620 isoform X1 [Galleria mellonella]
MKITMSRKSIEFEDEEYVDVRSLPLKPPQPALLPERPSRRPWHPVMWDDSIAGKPNTTEQLQAEQFECTKVTSNFNTIALHAVRQKASSRMSYMVFRSGVRHAYLNRHNGPIKRAPSRKTQAIVGTYTLYSS